MADVDVADRADALGTLRSLPAMWRWLTEGVPPPALDRPHPVSGRSVATEARRTAALLDGTGGERDGVAPADVVAAGVRSVLNRVDEFDDAVVGRLSDESSELFRSAGRALHASGCGAPTQFGRVVQLGASGGGVPKQPVAVAVVGVRGLDGDCQAERRHHGKPMQALCLWSADVIAALRAEGHGVYPGAAGENVTVAGVDWASVRPGTRLRLGDVLATVSAYATPCVKNAGWFVDRRFERILHDKMPGSSRVYAWVDTPGVITPGDRFVVEP